MLNTLATLLALTAQDVPALPPPRTAADLVARLGTKPDVQAELLQLRERAVPALLEALEAARVDADAARAELVLGVLGKLGSAAAGALERLVADHRGFRKLCAQAYLATVGDLVLFAPQGLAVDAVLGAASSGPLGWYQVQRVFLRRDADRDVSLAALVQMLSSTAIDIEIALDLIAQRGSGAGAALPAVAALLDRPDPRILGTDLRVGVRVRAAGTILAIAPVGPLAERARRVIAGHEPMPAESELEVPAPVRARIGALLAGLGAESDAVERLVAYGPIVIPQLEAMLQRDPKPSWCEGALAVLEQLAHTSPAASPALLSLLGKLPAARVPAILDALSASAPLGTDVIACSMSLGPRHIEVLGRRIPGSATVSELTAIFDAGQRLEVAQQLGPHTGLPTLLEALTDSWFWKRERALRLLARRGSDAQVALSHLGHVLENQHSLRRSWFRENGGLVTGAVDVTAELHKLAAEAILAIAPAEHPLVVRARAILAEGGPRAGR